MVEYTFTYRDSRSQSTIVKRYMLADDEEARELACLTFERFSVTVSRGNSVVIATCSSDIAGGVIPTAGLVLT